MPTQSLPPRPQADLFASPSQPGQTVDGRWRAGEGGEAATLDRAVFGGLYADLGADDWVMNDFLQTFVPQARLRVATARDAARSAEWAPAHAAVHTLASSAAMVGALRLQALCRAVDRAVARQEVGPVDELVVEMDRVAAALADWRRLL